MLSCFLAQIREGVSMGFSGANLEEISEWIFGRIHRRFSKSLSEEFYEENFE